MTSASASSISDSRPWLERFIWSFGSPNLCTSGELCNWHKDFTHALTFGRGISTPDYANTSLAVLWGHNPSHVWLAEADAVTAAPLAVVSTSAGRSTGRSSMSARSCALQSLALT